VDEADQSRAQLDAGRDEDEAEAEVVGGGFGEKEGEK
jgi:hypothetical protein